jgi:hypothetical protein
MRPAGHLLWAGAGVRGVAPAVDLFPASGTSMRLVDTTSRPEWPFGERALGSHTGRGALCAHTPHRVSARASTGGSASPLCRVRVARRLTLRYADAAPDRSDLLMTSTDAKQLVNLAKRMGIPTEDAVQRVMMRMVDPPADIKTLARSSTSQKREPARRSL